MAFDEKSGVSGLGTAFSSKFDTIRQKKDCRTNAMAM